MPLQATRPALSFREAQVGSQLVLVAGLSFACALIHLQAAVDHFSESELYGVLFVLLAVAQATFAVAMLRRPRRLLARGGMVGMAGVILAWIASRTVGLPVGPDVAGPEAAGLLDVIATIDEVAVLALLAGWAFPGRLGQRSQAAVRAISLLLILLSSLVLGGGTHAH